MQRLNLQNVFSRPSANSILASSYRGTAVKVHTFCRGSPHRLFAFACFLTLSKPHLAECRRCWCGLSPPTRKNGGGSPHHPLKYLNIFKE